MAMFPQFFKNPFNSIDTAWTWSLYVNDDVIQVDNNKNIEFFGKNLVDVALGTDWSV